VRARFFAIAATLVLTGAGASPATWVEMAESALKTADSEAERQEVPQFLDFAARSRP
jgi:hypothetical protein